jgi:RHS repeat-associated protein
VTSLAVRDGVYDGARRELVGFASVRVTRLGDAPEAALVTETEHELGLGDDRALRGLARQTQVYDGAGALLRKTRYQRATVPFAAAPDQPALATPVLLAVDERDSAGGAARETRVRYAYDALGREIEEARDGRLDLDGDESVVRRTYAEAGPQGVLDRVCEERRFTGDGELEAHTQTLFGTADAVLPACEAGPGWVCEVRQRALETDTWVTTSATRYDAHGNAIAITEGGVTRSLGYDPSGSFPVTESVSPAPGTTLTWTATWNPVLGVVEALAGPSGETTRVRHDGLGRVVSIASGDRAPHLRYAYRWDEPTPHTVTYTFDGALDDVVPLPEPGAARPGWREAIAVFNGAGELRYHAVRLDAARWVIGDYQRRDARGRVVEVAEGFYAESAFAAAPGPDVATQTLRYDALDRVVEQALATGATKRVEYAPFRRTATTAGLAPVTTELDGQGRAVRVQRSIDGALERVEARYDAAGRVRAFGLQGGAVSHRFDYDSLGRLVHASDPDLGERWLRYDADGRLVEHENGAGQIVRYDYDGAGRLVRVAADDGARFQYHYDAPRDAGFAFTVGRLAWVTEPTGIVELGYDELGRVARTRRDVDGRVADEHTGYAASGLVRETRYADGLALAIRYDGAARPIALAEVGARGELWRAEAVDAAGRIVSERFGNGISQAYTYDRLGQPSAVTLARGAQSLYGVAVTRNAWGGIERVDDVDGVGLDHAATYGYDGAARLTAATLGAAGAGYAFSYAYDGLQNMVARGATGPTAVGALTGTYCYGEPGAGPRQLTSVVAGACGAGATRASFAYDAAGREIASGARRSSYNGLDQLVRVDAVAGGTVEHAYGYDGLRVRTRAADGSVERWFSSSVSERGAVRAHDVRIGERLIARIELGGGPAPEGAPSAGAVKAAASGGLVMTLFALVWLALRSRREPRAWLRLTAATGALALAFGGCDTSGLGSLGRATEAVRTIVYAHTGIGAGPPLFTDDAGGVFAERRYEPFGVPIDELRHPLGDVASVGAVDFARAPTNGLNRLSDPDTGWSYHGARWMAPETARWLTPDPPVKAPAASFMSEPWALHPYQYVKQNPVLFWDPTGNYEELVHGALTYHLAVAAGFAQKDAAAIALNTQAVDENPGTAPVSLRNVVSGRTNRYHFNRDAAAAGFNAEVAKGKHMNLATLGLWLHGLEDHDAGGPHSGSSLGHPFRLTERGKVSTPFHHTNDQAWQNPKQYRRQLWQQYRYLKAAAIAKYGADNVTFDDDAALAAIDRVVGIRTRSSEMFFANTQIGDGPDGPLSYMDWRDKHADGTAGFRVNAKPWAGFGSSLANDIKPRNDPSWLDD